MFTFSYLWTGAVRWSAVGTAWGLFSAGNPVHWGNSEDLENPPPGRDQQHQVFSTHIRTGIVENGKQIYLRFFFTFMFTLSAIDRSICKSNSFWLVLWACEWSALTSRFAALRWLMPEPSWERSKSRFPRPSEYVSARLKTEKYIFI